MSRVADGGDDVADEMLAEERRAGFYGILGHGPLVDATGRDDGEEDGGRLQPALDDLEAVVARAGIRDAVRGVVARARYPLLREVGGCRVRHWMRKRNKKEKYIDTDSLVIGLGEYKIHTYIHTKKQK